jgi:hypothetical protein
VIAWLYREAGFKDDSDALMTELAKLAASAASRARADVARPRRCIFKDESGCMRLWSSSRLISS